VPVFKMLGADAIGLSLSHGFAVEPEQSTVAIVAHHPQASYYGMRSGRIPPDRAAAVPAKPHAPLSFKELTTGVRNRA
jgi:hypothetical protein